MKRIFIFSILIFCYIISSAGHPVLWTFSTDAEIYSSPVTCGDRIYFGSSDNYLYSLDKNSGQLAWKFKTEGKVSSTPLVSGNRIFINSSDGNIYSLDKETGKLLWKFATRGEKRQDIWDYYISSPVIDSSIVYVGSGDSTIYAICSKSGKPVWSFKTNGIVHATPVVRDNVVYIGSFDGYFYALNSRNGKLIWKFKTVGAEYFPKGEIQKAALIYKNTAYFGSRDYNIYALNIKTGTCRWNMRDGGGWIIATPFLYGDNIYFGTSDSHKFYCMEASSGEVLFTLRLNMRVYGTASQVNGKIVFGCFNGKLYSTNPLSGEIETLFQTEESKKHYSEIYNDDGSFKTDFVLYDKDYIQSEKKILGLGSILSDPLVENGIIYFGDSNGHFYAIKTSE